MPRSLQFLFGQYVPRCTHAIDKHFDYNVLQYMDGGAVALHVDGASYRLEGRYFWSSYPGPRIRFHSAAPTTTWVHRYLAFRGSVVNRWTRSGLFPITPQAPSAAAEYGSRFDELLELSRRADHWGLARAVLLLETILTELAEARSRPRHVPAWLQASLARITALGARIDYGDLAREAGLSSRAFRRRFVQATGLSPRGYAIASRISHARQMLGATELPIKTIADQLGYGDVFFFSRQFTRFTGISPAAYRRSKEQ